MPVISRKFRSKYYNSDDFSTDLTDFNENLAGSVMEVKQATYEIEIVVRSKAATNLPFTVDTTTKTITRSSGDFLEDGFRIGDSVAYFWDSTKSATFDIVSVSQTEIVYTNAVGTDTIVDGSFDDGDIQLTSDLTAFSFNYNIIPNDETIYNNFIDETTQGWYAEGMTDGGSAVDCSPIGETTNKSWINGSATCQWVKGSNGLNTFTIVHEFVIPYYEEGQLENIQDLNTPDEYNGTNSFKYIANYEFLRTLTFPNSGRGLSDENILGSVGWLNEPYNGLNMPFTISNVVYEDTSSNVIDKIVADTDTVIKFTCTSSDSSFSSSTNTGVYASKLPSLLEYQDKTNNFNTNWIYDSVHEVCGTAFTGGTTITDYEATYVDANTITVEMTVNFANVESTDNYLIAFEIASDGGSNTASDKTILKVDSQTFEKSADVTGLMSMNEMFFELYPDAVGDNDYTNFEGWIEDSINCNFQFELDTSKGAFLNELYGKIVAYNTSDGTWFELEKVPFPLQSGVVVSGVQTFDIDKARGFNMDKGDYNIIKLNNLISTPPIQEYEGQISFKMDWQSWLSLPNADTIFYDNSKENNGLNENASNYSLSNGYEIRFLIDAVVSDGNVNTNYVFSSPQNRVYNYDLDDQGTPYWDGVIETYNDAGTLLGEGILSEGDTTIKAIFTPSSGSWTNESVIISLEPIDAPSKNQITIYDATVTYDGSDVVGTYVLNSSEVEEGIKYKISSRLRCEENACTPNVVSLSITYPTAKSGIFNLAMGIFESDGTTPLNTGIVKFTFDDNGTDLYEATFNIGDNIATATPLSDTGTNSFSDIQAYFSSTIIQNGNTFTFDKKSWADDEGRIDDGSGSTDAEFTVEFQTTSPCSSNVASDTIDNKTWMEFRSSAIPMNAGSVISINPTLINLGTLGTVTARTDYYNSTNATYLNPTGAIFSGSNTPSGAHPASNTTIASGYPEVQIGQIQTVADGNCLNSRYIGSKGLFLVYTSAGTWDEGQNLTFTRATQQTMSLSGISSTVKLIKGGTVAVPTNNVPLQPRATGGTTESTDSYGSIQTTLNIDIPLGSGYGVFHIEDVLTATSGGASKEVQDIILIKIYKY